MPESGGRTPADTWHLLLAKILAARDERAGPETLEVGAAHIGGATGRTAARNAGVGKAMVTRLLDWYGPIARFLDNVLGRDRDRALLASASRR